jgi:hypothetical protein
LLDVEREKIVVMSGKSGAVGVFVDGVKRRGVALSEGGRCDSCER